MPVTERPPTTVSPAMALVPPHIRRLPGAPRSLADRLWMKGARTLRPFRRKIAGPQFARVPDGARLSVDPIDVPPLAELPEPLIEPAREVIREAREVLEHRMKFI